MKEILKVTGLTTSFFTEQGVIKAADGVDLTVRSGETVGLVGESGCGKSVTALSILRIIPSPPGRITSGTISFMGNDLLSLTEREMQKIRGDSISMIFQEPMTSLNPVYTIGEQICEVFRFHRDMDKREIKERSIELLKKVGIPAPEQRFNDYPHQFSGGMRQRVMIAMALALSPTLMIADEPTTALDVTIQASILALMEELKQDRNMSMILITHDLGVVSEVATRISVMYAGKIVENSDATGLFENPLHPYTRGLLKSLPSQNQGGNKLYTIGGSVPRLFDLPRGCRFHPRCPHAMDRCRKEEPPLKTFGKKGGTYHTVYCWLYE
jgi:oligopeptide transport system ATP-binding protein